MKNYYFKITIKLDEIRNWFHPHSSAEFTCYTNYSLRWLQKHLINFFCKTNIWELVTYNIICTLRSVKFRLWNTWIKFLHEIPRGILTSLIPFYACFLASRKVSRSCVIFFLKKGIELSTELWWKEHTVCSTRASPRFFENY